MRICLPTLQYYNTKAEPRCVERAAIAHLGGVIPTQPELKVVLVKRPDDKRVGYQMTKKITQYRLICMDASNSLFLAILETGLNDTFDNELTPGTSLHITDYHWVFMDHGEQQAPHYGAVIRAVVFVKKLTWEEGPSQDDAWENYENPKTHTILRVKYPKEVVAMVERTQFCVFTKSVRIDGDETQWSMSEDEIMRGDWLENLSTRCWWNKRTQRLACKTDEENDATCRETNKENSASCDCLKFGFKKCLVELQPATTLDPNLVFQQAVSRLPDEDLEAESFFDLTPSKQRWCFYWWYSVNLLHFKSRSPTPACLQKHLRQTFKNAPNVPHVGYKASKQALSNLKSGVI